MRETAAKIRSACLKNERTIWISEPARPALAQNLTIFLDGEFYRERVGVADVIDALEGEIADSWFVFVSTESIEARWVECPCYPPFAQFVAEELIPWLEQRHPEMVAIQSRVLVGLSYTALAAAFVVREYPGLFQKVISQSGSYWSNDCWLVEQFGQSRVRLSTEFYLEVGLREIQGNVQHRENLIQIISQIEGVRRFRDVLIQLGHSVTYVEFDGGHEFEAWRETLPDALKWALPKL